MESLYKFFNKSAVWEFYEGSALKRLIETRWSGHYDSVNHVHNNYGDLINTLSASVIFPSAPPAPSPS